MMHLPTRYHIRILAGLSLSLAAAVASAGENRSYQLVEIPQRALAPVDAYLVGRLLPEEQPAAQLPADQQLTLQQTAAPHATEGSEPTYISGHGMHGDGATSRASPAHSTFSD
jgi:hypothetical protein